MCLRVSTSPHECWNLMKSAIIRTHAESCETEYLHSDCSRDPSTSTVVDICQTAALVQANVNMWAMAIIWTISFERGHLKTPTTQAPCLSHCCHRWSIWAPVTLENKNRQSGFSGSHPRWNCKGQYINNCLVGVHAWSFQLNMGSLGHTPFTLHHSDFKRA